MPSKSQKFCLRNIKLTLEYEGSRFFGFQRQVGRPTVQAVLEKSLSRLFNCPTKIAAAAGRTDAGVHAESQVVSVKTSSVLPLEKIQRGLNALLPREVAVKKVEEVPLDFNARYHARWKTYEYQVLNSRIRSPLLNGRAYQYPYELDLQEMRKAARRLVGRLDFKAFQAAGAGRNGSVRCVKRLAIHKEGALIRFVIEADGFLYHMVRNIVGTLLEVGRGRLSQEDFRAVLRSRERILAGPTVPAHGLTLLEVKYVAPGKVAKSGRF